MIKSNVIVEQVNSQGVVVNDYGEILNNSELSNIICNSFNCEEKTKGECYGFYKKNPFCLLYKNISYLGIPHPTYKKRIQIPNKYIKICEDNARRNIPTFFIGVYTYKDNVVFVNFDTTKYITRKAHNSSAHVLVIDLINATIEGNHFKTDKGGNEIFCFSKNNIEDFFERYVAKTISKLPVMFQIFNEFYDSFPKKWYGKKCYDEMFKADYHRKGQPEWQGAYIEFLFEKYVALNNISNFVVYAPIRNKKEYDLDLYFLTLHEYGDLKMHSEDSGAIIGNKTETILDCVNKNECVYYFVYNHSTEKDDLYSYETTKHWNKLLNKDNPLSYKDRMKHSILIKNYQILRIDKNNLCYLKDFQNGFRNSDGSLRTAKIKINKGDINNFLLYEHS